MSRGKFKKYDLKKNSSATHLQVAELSVQLIKLSDINFTPLIFISYLCFLFLTVTVAMISADAASSNIITITGVLSPVLTGVMEVDEEPSP